MTRVCMENIETGKLLSRFVSGAEEGVYVPTSSHLSSLVELRQTKDRKGQPEQVVLSFPKQLFSHPVLGEVVMELVREFLGDCLLPVPTEVNSRKWMEATSETALKLKGAQLVRKPEGDLQTYSIQISKGFFSGLLGR